MASYPASVKTFGTKNAGDTIQPSHINDLQDEVTAIEDGLLNGSAPVNSSRITAASLSVAGASTLADLVVTANPPSALVSNSSGNVAIPNNTATAVPFESQTFISTSAMHSTATNNTRLIAPSSGVYVVNGFTTWNAFSTAGIRELKLFVNSTTTISVQRSRPDIAGNGHGMCVSAIYKFQANDYVEMIATHDGGSTGSVSGPTLAMAKLR